MDETGFVEAEETFGLVATCIVGNLESVALSTILFVNDPIGARSAGGFGLLDMICFGFSFG